jgi:hypothetical protein
VFVQIRSMFWPKELGPIYKDRCTILCVFFFLNGFAIKKICLGVFVVAPSLDLTLLLIGMVRWSRSSSILHLLR